MVALGWHPYLVVALADHSLERSSCVGFRFFLLSFKTHVSLWPVDNEYSFCCISLAKTHRLLRFSGNYPCSFLSSFGETKAIFCSSFQWCSRKYMCVFLVFCFDEIIYKLRMFFSLTRTFFMKHFTQNILVDNKLKTIECLWSLKHQIKDFVLNIHEMF